MHQLTYLFLVILTHFSVVLMNMIETTDLYYFLSTYCTTYLNHILSCSRRLAYFSKLRQVLLKGSDVLLCRYVGIST